MKLPNYISLFIITIILAVIAVGCPAENADSHKNEPQTVVSDNSGDTSSSSDSDTEDPTDNPIDNPINDPIGDPTDDPINDPTNDLNIVLCSYTVKTFFQKTTGGNGDDDYELVKTETRQGRADAETDVTADSVTGFELLPITQKTVAENGSTVIEVKYNRKTIEYTFHTTKGKWDDNSTTDKIVSGLFDASVDVPTPTYKTGWSYTWEPPVPATFGADDKSFTASWTENKYAYTIMFKANGGVGSDVEQQMTYDKNGYLTANSFTRDGYIFIGWNEDADAKTVQYADKCKVKNLTEPDGTVILYAVWIKLGQNIKIGDTVYTKTSMIQVLDQSTDLTCDRDGVFPEERVSVTLGKYAIGRYEVTQQLYEAVMGNNPSRYTESQAALGSGETTASLRAVERVSWYDAITFCNKLSLLTGKTPCYTVSGISDWSGAVTIPTSNDANWDNAICDWTADGYRLPTECEWECAARGGVYSAERKSPWRYDYSGSNTIEDVAWYYENSNYGSKKIHVWEVGLKAPNSLGIYDMSGNVEEWCWDYYGGAEIDSGIPVTGPAVGLPEDFPRQARGGFYESPDTSCEVSYRAACDRPYAYSDNLGFRIACREAE